MRTAASVVTLVASTLLMAACASDDAGVRVDSTNSSPPAFSDLMGTMADIDPCPTTYDSGELPGDGEPLPDVVLSCLGPGASVTMAELTGPMVVNVWASWCSPCRDELPWFQRLHDDGRVAVLGVDAEDSPAAAAALLDDLDVRFPSVFDPDNEFAKGMGLVAKPLTVFVSRRGEAVHVLPGPIDSYDDLARLVDEHLGVSVR